MKRFVGKYRVELLLLQVRSITLKDFESAICVVRPTVVEKDLIAYREWDSKFGSLNTS